MSESQKKHNLWFRAKTLVKNIRKNGLKEVTGVISFSLFFMMGLVMLGACLFAGVAAVIIAKWQQYKTQNSDVAEPAAPQEPNNPIVAA
ncbi:hypothetical protein [Endozoicomonas sp.]|uniref:hypothetical protein n=1 Tax=Endozoicomonas sp. TaxID=1892382 RepID=UPI00288709D5|nr:hypothetical protein [Endozoicomonas sp.]